MKQIGSNLSAGLLLAALAMLATAQAKAQEYTFLTLAGLAGSPGSADGTGSAAQFRDPTSVAVDSAGNVYVADLYNYTIREVTPGVEGLRAHFFLPAGVTCLEAWGQLETPGLAKRLECVQLAPKAFGACWRFRDARGVPKREQAPRTPNASRHYPLLVPSAPDGAGAGRALRPTWQSSQVRAAKGRRASQSD